MAGREFELVAREGVIHPAEAAEARKQERKPVPGAFGINWRESERSGVIGGWWRTSEAAQTEIQRRKKKQAP